MILFKQLETLQRMHRLIAASHTGTPKEFAKRLGVSERHLRGMLDEMKDMDAPIKYSRTAGTYYCTKPSVVQLFNHF